MRLEPQAGRDSSLRIAGAPQSTNIISLLQSKA